MEEKDVGKVFAALAPETVPTVGGMQERARALGRRQRRRRAAMTGGGAGIALAGVVGAVVTLGGFGAGDGSGAGHAAPVSSGSGGQAAQGSGGMGGSAPSKPLESSDGSNLSSPPTAPWSPPTSPGQPPHTFPPLVHNPAADAEVLAAIKAALPAQDQDKPTLYRAAGTPKDSSYGAEYNWGPRSDGVTLGVSVGPLSTVKGTPTTCQSDPAHCTTGTATLHGDPVTWEYTYGGAGGTDLIIYDDKAKINYLLAASGTDASKLPGLAELKDVGLNEQVASALLAAIPQH